MGERICASCGRYTNTRHHLIFGRGLRSIADDDDIWMPLCDWCHNMATKPEDRIHENPMAEKLSKMLGQALWEGDYVARQLSADDKTVFKEQQEAREAFRNRYGRSYL